MNQTVLTGSDLNKCAEVHKANYLALVDSTDLRIVCDSIDDLDSLLSTIVINARYEYITLIVDVDLYAAVSGDLLDNLSALTDNFTDLVNRNLSLKHLGSVLADVISSRI